VRLPSSGFYYSGFGSLLLQGELRTAYSRQQQIRRIDEQQRPIWPRRSIEIEVEGKLQVYEPPFPSAEEESTADFIGSDRPPAGLYQLRAQHSGLCLSVHVNTRNLNHQSYPSSLGANQMFRLEPLDNGVRYMIKSLSGDVWTLKMKAMMTGRGCLSTAVAETRINSSGCGRNGHAFEIIAEHSGKCLDVWGDSREIYAEVRQHRCHGGPNQKWKLTLLEK
jgi:hypothetical protein